MTTVADVAAWLDRFAPRELAEEWDNTGLLCGDPQTTCSRVMTCLSIDPITAREAVAAKAELVVSHHPVLLRPVQSLRADRPETAAVWMLAREGISVYSPHTAFDNSRGGINDLLGRKLGLVEVGALTPPPKREGGYKIVVFCPRDDRERVLAAAFAAGAGRIGAYAECSFSARGLGTFFGDETTNPAVGQKGRRETAREWRVEVICPDESLGKVLAAIRASHSYEEPAIDVYPLLESAKGPGIGRLGSLPKAKTVGEFATDAGHALQCATVQIVGERARPIQKIAIACGAGDSLVETAARAGADVLVTGELRYHRALQAEALGLAALVAGHYATERPGVEQLAERLSEAFPALQCWPSRDERDPLAWIGTEAAR